MVAALAELVRPADSLIPDAERSVLQVPVLRVPDIKVVPECIRKIEGYPHLQERVLRSTPAELVRLFDEVSTPFCGPQIRPLTVLTADDRTELIAWVSGSLG